MLEFPNKTRLKLSTRSSNMLCLEDLLVGQRGKLYGWNKEFLPWNISLLRLKTELGCEGMTGLVLSCSKVHKERERLRTGRPDQDGPTDMSFAAKMIKSRALSHVSSEAFVKQGRKRFTVQECGLELPALLTNILNAAPAAFGQI